MKLPKNASDNVCTLFYLIQNRSLTSIELRKLTKSSYPPVRIADCKALGLSIHATYEPYVNRNGHKSRIARYTLLSPIKQAKEIYKKLAA